MIWAEKYRPKSLREIVGQKKAIEQAKSWIESWISGNPSKPAALFHGPPGCGKTATAYALARDYGLEYFELNASDKRNYSTLKSLALPSSISSSLFGERRRLIVLDEADNLNPREDSQATRGITLLLRSTRNPVVLTANKYWEVPREIRNHCLLIQFNKLKERDILSVLKRISSSEGLEVSEEVLMEIARRSLGDLRAAINDLQAVGSTGLDGLGYRDREENIFQALARIIKSNSMQSAKASTSGLDMTPDELLTWIEENSPRVMTDLRSIAEAYYYISRADQFLSRVTRRQYYGFWSYALELMTGGVALSKKEIKFSKFQSPRYVKEMASTAKFRRIRDSIASKISEKCHVSRRIALSEYLPYLSLMIKHGKSLSEFFDFTEEEVEYLRKWG